MKTARLIDVKAGRITNAYIWTDIGDGSYEPVLSIFADWWVNCGDRSFSCTPDTVVCVFDDAGQRLQAAELMRDKLEDDRRRWARRIA